MAFNHKNIRNTFIFILVLVTIDSQLFDVQCLGLSKFDLPERFDNEFSEEFNIHNPVDLNIGAPDFLPPSFIRYALSNATESLDASFHQYMDTSGYEELREEISRMYSPLIKRPLNVMDNVIVTMGATQALLLTMLTYTTPGDEWIVLEPAFRNYFGIFKLAGAKVTPVALRTNVTQGRLSSGDLIFDKDEMRKAFNSRTKGILVNNPHNPTGKVFTKEELLFIAELAIKWDVLIISDEVYEWTMFDSTEHIRMASLGEHIFNRTITVCSMSKTFFATGWRIGWAYGPSKLIGDLNSRQPSAVLSVNSHAQVASAEVLRKMRYEFGRPNSYFANLPKFLEQKRDFMVNFLNEIGMETTVPETGYYILANWTNLESRIPGLEEEEGNTKDMKFVNWLIKNVGVIVAPGTFMYSDNNMGESYIRLCFSKKTETLQRAAALLKKQFPQ